MDTIALGISLFAVLLNVIALIAGAIWVVARVDKTTAVLSNNLQYNSEATRELKLAIQPLYTTINDHATRIALLEQRRLQCQQNES